ncbi:MBL fold metallo-hydrolase [Schinkia azotoformans]|uniref:MBL fold metallo-hydrolase n=1 Tax=Schinkia azotoformans TaxID=1454 RepID=UPI002E1BEC6C|nr:MBL fold metallo-hydrolase [Schinkia azotoformans]
MNKKPVNLGNNISFFDVFDLGMENRTGTYVIHDEKLTIVETSASPSIPYLLEGLKNLEIDPSEIHYIIVTHIHLDHAGGAGLLLKQCPNAKVIVHPRGFRHLIDPSRLIAGARLVYGDDFDRLYDPIYPIPEDRLIVKQDGETLEIGKRTLTFYDTPGHAKHHFSIHDSLSNGIFTGDTIGIYYQDVEEFDFFLPSTSPNQFDPDDMLHSLKKIEELNVSLIYFGHFGKSNNPSLVYSEIKKWLPVFVETGKEIYLEHKEMTLEELTPLISENLFGKIKAYLSEKNIPNNHKVYTILKLDIDVCSMGLADYFIRIENKK